MIKILHYKPEYQPYFEKLNREWIEKSFKIEPLDIRVLTNPEDYIIKPGGSILFAEYKGEIIGTVALRKLSPGILEMTKMAVNEQYRGLGAGKKLIEAAKENSRQLEAKKLVLYSNTKFNMPAIELYRKMGFIELPLESGVYERADIKMGIDL